MERKNITQEPFQAIGEDFDQCQQLWQSETNLDKFRDIWFNWHYSGPIETNWNQLGPVGNYLDQMGSIIFLPRIGDNECLDMCG